jgi:hypothetical protein
MGGKCAFTLATVGGSPTSRTLRTMDGALLTWGCHLVGRAGRLIPVPATIDPAQAVPLILNYIVA